MKCIYGLSIGNAVEAGFEDVDYLWCVIILLLQLLVVTATLKRIACFYEICHFLVKLVTSPLLLRPHPFLIEVDEDDVLHMFKVGPLATSLSRHIVAVPFLAGVFPLPFFLIFKAHD